MTCFENRIPRPRLYGTADPQGYDIKLNTFRTSVALKFMIIFIHNLTTANHRKSGESKYDRNLTELDVVTTRIRYRVNGVLVLSLYFRLDQNCQICIHVLLKMGKCLNISRYISILKITA